MSTSSILVKITVESIDNISVNEFKSSPKKSHAYKTLAGLMSSIVFNDPLYSKIEDLVYYGNIKEQDLKKHVTSMFFPSPYYDAMKKWNLSNAAIEDITLCLAAAKVTAENGELIISGTVHRSNQVLQATINEELFKQKLEEIVSGLPEKLQNFVRTKSWDEGHAYGYREVLNVAQNLASQLV